MASLQEELALLKDVTAKAVDKEAKTRDLFISARTRHEAVITAMAEGLKDVDPSLIKDIKIPKDITCQAMFPSLYADAFDHKAYEAELQIFKELQRSLGLVLKELVSKARADMEAYVHD